MESLAAATKSYRSDLSTTENYYIILPEVLENATIKVVENRNLNTMILNREEMEWLKILQSLFISVL